MVGRRCRRASPRETASRDIAASSRGHLTQVLNLGMIAEYLNVELQFDPKTKRFVGNEEANQLLAGAKPRSEWAHYYTLA